MHEPRTVPLSAPIEVIDQEFTSITLRPPTGKDIVRAGYPLKFNEESATEVIAPAMFRMIAVLAQNATSKSIENLPACDWQSCCLTVMGFFGPPPDVQTSFVDTVTWKEPTGKDIADAGYPLKFTINGGTEIHATAMSKMIGILGGLSEDAVGELPAHDWQDAALVIMGFFAPPEARRRSSGDTSNLAAGGAT